MTCEGRNIHVASVLDFDCVWDMGNTCRKVSHPLRRRATSKCDEVEMKETEVKIPNEP